MSLVYVDQHALVLCNIIGLALFPFQMQHTMHVICKIPIIVIMKHLMLKSSYVIIVCDHP